MLFMNLVRTLSPNFGSGMISRFSALCRRDMPGPQFCCRSRSRLHRGIKLAIRRIPGKARIVTPQTHMRRQHGIAWRLSISEDLTPARAGSEILVLFLVNVVAAASSLLGSSLWRPLRKGTTACRRSGRKIRAHPVAVNRKFVAKTVRIQVPLALRP